MSACPARRVGGPRSMLTHEIRAAYLDFFADRGHRVVPSSSLVPANDSTLLFTNAGMVQFKDALTGRERPEFPRAASCQRCVRAGGKHNDLESVGYTGRHHTLFEMLGNFSFGDYYKQEAIAWAWEFVMRVLRLPKERLWVTVHPDDAESRAIWLNAIGLDARRVIAHASNFWAMGDTGPCGPNSEIFYDLGPEVPGGPPGSANEEGDRYSEIWNLVFPQFDRMADGTLEPLASPGVDTGMGLERVAAVMQGGRSNYDNDLFQRLLAVVADLAGVDAAAASENPSLRVLADHARAAVFLLADGVMPSNEDRGYVLRRIVRRGLRHGRKLNIRGAVLQRLVAPVVEIMGAAYPEIRDRAGAVTQALAREEERFGETLNAGMALLERAIANLGDATELPGDLVFKLYDTHGFPADMTADIAREHGLAIDQAGFEAAMARQRARGRANAKFDGGLARHVRVDSSVRFTGYQCVAGEGSVVALFREQDATSAAVDELTAQDSGIAVLDATPFYAEAGGQVGDAGLLESVADDGRIIGVFEVRDTTKGGDQHLHHGRIVDGALRNGAKVRARIDRDRRQAVTRNHSATHLLHAALRQVLGDHVEQKGSLVAPDRLRFDFSHQEPVSVAQQRRVEAVVNARIRDNTEVRIEELPFEQAAARGALALFGEKYGDRVRVLTMGEGFSIELCGGTHVERTGDIGVLRIVAEESVAAGVRRVEALTGALALEWIDEGEAELGAIAELVKSRRGNVAGKIEQLVERAKSQRQELEALRARFAANQGAELAAGAISVNGVQVLAAAIDGDPEELRPMLDNLRRRLGESVVVLAHNGQRARLVCSVSAGVVERLSAGDLVRFVGEQIGAKGGGRRDMAQAGGGDRPERLPQALASVADWVRDRVAAP